MCVSMIYLCMRECVCMCVYVYVDVGVDVSMHMGMICRDGGGFVCVTV